MFALYANKNELAVRQRERMTSGSVSAYDVQFEFSSDWEGMTKRAVFRAGRNGKPLSAPWTEDGLCEIPWEVITTPAVHVYAGIYGTRGETVVLPTVWADLGAVLEGVSAGNDAKPPTPELWRQELDRKQDKLLGFSGQVVGFDTDGRAVPVDAPSGGGREGESIAYDFGHGLKQTGKLISVDAVSDFKGDNTLPITAAGVQNTLGNIEALLATI